MYYIFRDRKTHGPYIKDKVIEYATSDTLVSNNNEWRTFSSHPDFAGLASSVSVTPTPSDQTGDRDLNILEDYVFKHTVPPAPDMTLQELRARFDSEYVRLFIEASHVHKDIAEPCLARMGNADWPRSEAPDLHAASLLTARSHLALGSEFDTFDPVFFRSTREEIRGAYPHFGTHELELLRGCLQEGERILKYSENRWAALKAPTVRGAPPETLFLLEARIDVAAKILEAFEPGAAPVILGATKIRYYLPDLIWAERGAQGRLPEADRFMDYWDSYVPTESPVGSIYLHRMQEIPDVVLEGLGGADTPKDHPRRFAAQIALLPDQEVEDLGKAVKTARWALVFPSGHHRVQD
ncbi:MAG: hypothetical protein GY719_01335 [bacterium]|nr:hypothetical protein [bacterium]